VTVPIAQAPVHEGDILDGKYRVDRVLGAGGMGVVVAATHVQLNTQVALKFLLAEVLNEPTIVERFVREARAAVQIQSEHVARVTDVSTLPTGSPYMVMEFLEGQDLAQHLTQQGALPVTQAVGFLLQACEAVAEAHALGIVHRDLKPANLFLTQRHRREPIIKVLDFGISKSQDSGSLNLTNTATMMGSPYYMSPEQMKSARDVDPRSDIWAIGVILFELLTGQLPFQGNSITEVVVSVTTSKVPNIRDLRSEVPVGLVEVIARCLERDPDRRFADVGALAKALVPFGPPRSDISVERISRILGAGVSAAPGSLSVAPSHATGLVEPRLQGTAAAWGNTSDSSRATHKGSLIALLAVVAIVTLTVILWRVNSAPNTPTITANASVPTEPATSVASALSTTSSTATAPIVLLTAAALVSTEPALSVAKPQGVAPAKPPANPPATRPTERRKNTPAIAPAERAPVAPPPANRGLNMGMKE